jgi:hypothetical protein
VAAGLWLSGLGIPGADAQIDLLDGCNEAI